MYSRSTAGYSSPRYVLFSPSSWGAPREGSSLPAVRRLRLTRDPISLPNRKGDWRETETRPLTRKEGRDRGRAVGSRAGIPTGCRRKEGRQGGLYSLPVPASRCTLLSSRCTCDLPVLYCHQCTPRGLSLLHFWRVFGLRFGPPAGSGKNWREESRGAERRSQRGPRSLKPLKEAKSGVLSLKPLPK